MCGPGLGPVARTFQPVSLCASGLKGVPAAPSRRVGFVPCDHEYLNFKGGRFSKSRGAAVEVSYFLSKYDPDALCLSLPRTHDSAVSAGATLQEVERERDRGVRAVGARAPGMRKMGRATRNQPSDPIMPPTEGPTSTSTGPRRNQSIRPQVAL